MTYRKKLIEVALPLEAINEASVRESYIYKGNPSSMHKWWAQRPLAAALPPPSALDEPWRTIYRRVARATHFADAAIMLVRATGGLEGGGQLDDEL